VRSGTRSQKRAAALNSGLALGRSEFKAAARFFDLVRDLTATAFYTTPEGMKDIGYIGNVALPRFDPPPKEILEKLGLV